MKQHLAPIVLLLFAGLALSSCGGSPGAGQGGSTMPPADSTPTSSGSSAPAQVSSTQPPSGAYPKMGRAPDYSWIAGRVSFTRIQGGCVYILTEDAPLASTPSPGAGGVVVGTAVNGSESPPLRDITPNPPGAAASQGPIGPSFVPSGKGWDASKVADGDYVVLFGQVAGPGQPREMCPGGTSYVADAMQRSP